MGRHVALGWSLLVTLGMPSRLLSQAALEGLLQTTASKT